MPTDDDRETRMRAWLRSLTDRFVRLPSDEVESAIEEGLREIVEFLDVDRSTLFEFDATGSGLRGTHSWSREELRTVPFRLARSELPWYCERLAAGEQIVMRRLPDDLPEEAIEERRYCLEHGMVSNLTLPIRVGGVPTCALALGSFRKHVDWTDEVVEQVQLAAEILAAGLYRQRQEQELARSRELAHDFFDSLNSMAAVLDRDGVIRGVNQAWRTEAGQISDLFEGSAPGEPIGASYLDLLAASADRGNESAGQALAGIRAVLAGERPAFLMEYPGEHESGERWTLLRVLSRKGDAGGAILMHVDITERVHNTSRLEHGLREVEKLRSALEEEKLYLKEEIKSERDFENVVGRSAELKSVLSRVERVAATTATVLLLGETGSGKELIARAIHERSARSQRALIKVSCAALPPSLIESELFGHVRGAFTGAVADRKGRFELADGGTLFLDEIGELELGLQAKLLRVIETKEFERVGGTTTKRVDVRLIAATHRDIASMMGQGEFRRDLFFRLNTFPIEVPPLRRRREDIPLLVWHFLDRCEREWGRRITRVPAPVMEALQEYSWPGNVRELQNVIERAVILSAGDELLLDPGSLGPVQLGVEGETDESLDALQRAHISRTLESCQWRINGPGNAAERLGIHPNTLRHRLKKLGIHRPR